MTEARKLSARDQAYVMQRAGMIDAIVGAETGIDHLARKDQWSNSRKAGARAGLVRMIRGASSQRKNGARAVLEEGADVLSPSLVQAVYQADADAVQAAAERARIKAAKDRAQARPTSAEIAAAAQAGDTSNPEAVEAAEALAASIN